MGLGSFSSAFKVSPKIKIHIDQDGKIVTIEKEENGLWILDSKLTALLEELPKTLHIQKKAIITIIQ